MRSSATLRRYPGQLIGIRVGYNEAFLAAFKTAVPMRMWDPLSKTWWFPEDYLLLVEQLGLQHGVVRPSDLEKFKQTVPTSRSFSNAYEVLALQPNAPRSLVDQAYRYWKSQFSDAMGAGGKLAEIEEAYLTIVGDPTA